MKSKAIIPLVLGLCVGIFAIKLFVDVLKKVQGATPDAQGIQVVVSKADIGTAIEITEGMVEMKEVPASLAPPGVFDDLEAVVGRVSSQAIPKGVPVLDHSLAPPGTPPGMASRIREGFRAFTVEVNEVTGVGGWLKPGSKVDVIVVLNPKVRGSCATKTLSKVILQNVEVLAIGQEIQSEGPDASVSRSVTLLVEPKEVTKLHLAASKGKLQLAMRNPEDMSAPKSVATTDNELLTDEAAPKTRGPSLFTRLFSKDPKTDSDQTDKTPKVVPKPEPMPVKIVQAPPEPKSTVWAVQLIQGSAAGEVYFEDDSRSARRVSAEEGQKALQQQKASQTTTTGLPGNVQNGSISTRTIAGPVVQQASSTGSGQQDSASSGGNGDSQETEPEQVQPEEIPGE